MSRTRGAFLAPALALLLAIAGCQSSAPAATPGATLTLNDGWVKAADSGMTAAFGTLENPTDDDITLVSASSDLSRMEMHEVTAGADGTMAMHPKDGGFVVPAHGSLTLDPGGLHLMFMDLAAPLAPGDTVDFTVTSHDDLSWTFSAPVRTFTGANEQYQGGGAMDSTGGGASTMPSMTP